MELVLICLGVLGACFGLKKKSKRPPRDSPDFLDRVMFTQNGLEFTFRDCCQGILCLGQVGSGKTTGVLQSLTNSLLRAGCGGLYLCAKPDDRSRLLKACKKIGRLDDLILIDRHARQRLNFFKSLMRVRSDPATMAQMAANGFDVFSQVAGRNQSQGWGDDGRFWGEANSRMLRSVLLLLILARMEITPLAILKVVQTIPQTPDEARTPQWKESYAGKAMMRAFENAKAHGKEAEFDAVSDYVLKELPSLGLKTRSNIVAMVTGTADGLTKGLAAQILATDSTFDLSEAIQHNRVIIIDLDYGTWDEVARFTGAGIKYLIQREILRREVTPATKPFVIMCDEYQNVLTEFDWQYVSMQRSFRGPMCVASQGWESICAKLGGEKGRSQAEVLVGNLGCNFICSPTFQTATWVTEQLGRKKQRFYNASGGTSGPPQSPGDFLFGSDDKRSVSANAGFSESFELVLQTNQLTRMATGGPKHGFQVGCLFLQPGREHPYYWLTFDQEKS